MVGQTVSHYKLLERLGSGGMGVVYKAEDTKLGRLVALKFLAEEVVAKTASLERFLREARTAASISSPHICTIHEIGEHEGSHFIVMELLEGRTLREMIGQGKLEVITAVRFALQITEGLAAAHAKGVIHRDIKPSNVFCVTGGKIKILDFGLARPTGLLEGPEEEETLAMDAPTETFELTTDGSTVGTVAYMSPEQALGEDLDARTDLFSLGAVLYEMLTGQRAFTGSTHAAIYDKILNHPPESPAKLGLQLPFELGIVLEKSLEKDRKLRYQTAAEVHTDLLRVQRELTSGSQSTAAAQATGGGTASGSWARAEPASRPPETQAPVVRRRPWIFGAALLTVLVVAAAAWLWRRPPPVGLEESDTVLLTDFANATDDPVFDGTLRQALAVKLEESPYLNVMPRRQVQEALRFMDRPGNEPLTVELGHEICERQGIKAIVTGELAPIGSRFVVTLNALACRSGEALAREQIEVASKEEVLGAVGRGATRIRRRLGESLASVGQFDAPIEQATTSSLEALKAFSLGEERRAVGAEQEAIVFYKRALELDPQFAVAHGRLGTIYVNLGERETGVDYKAAAYELRERASERERLYITAHYYSDVTGELEREIETYELFKRTYPHVWTPHNNLAVLLNDLGRYEQAAEEAAEAVRLEPDRNLPYSNLVEAQIALGRLDEARDLLEFALDRFVGTQLYVLRYQLAYLEDDRQTLERMIEAVAGEASEVRLLEVRVQQAAAEGRMEDSRELRRRAVEAARRQGLPELGAEITAWSALWEALLGDPVAARELAAASLEAVRSRETLRLSALAFALTGAGEDARSQLEELQERFPQNTLVQELYGPTIEAALALEGGDVAAAVNGLERTAPYDSASLGTLYLRARAHQEAGNPEMALKELEKILDRPGVAPTSPFRTLAHLAAARALAAQGDSAAADAYRAFLARTEAADEEWALRRVALRENESLGAAATPTS